MRARVRARVRATVRGVRGISSDGVMEGFFWGFEIFDSRIFGGRKIWQVFFWGGRGGGGGGWLDLSKAFFSGFQKNLKICCSARYPGLTPLVMISFNPFCKFLKHGIFGGLIFGPGIFCGFCWKS